MIATSKQIRFTVDEYMKMAAAGVFGSRKVELLQGRIVRMPAQAHPHRWSMSKTVRAFVMRFQPERFWVVGQGTLTLNRYNAPDPDIHVFDVPEGTDEELLPKAFVVIEISDTTYRKDSGIKLRSYAAAGIQDYWIVNLKQRRVEVYRKPENPTGRKKDWRYAEVREFKPGQKIALLAYPKISIPVNEMVP
jgi:Uma2 family endonuclease